MAESAERHNRGRLIRDLNLLALLTLIAASSGLLLLPSRDDGLLGLPELAVGDPAPRNIRSPQAFTIEDPDSTARNRARAREEVLRVYDHHLWVGSAAKQRLVQAFESARPRPEREAGDGSIQRVRDFILALGATVNERVLLPVVTAEDLESLRDAALMVAETAFEVRIVEDKALLALEMTPNGAIVRMLDKESAAGPERVLTRADGILGLDQARARVDQIVSEQLGRLARAERRGVAAVVKRVLRPNLLPNPEETERRRVQAAESVKPTFFSIQPGETIVRAGETIDPQRRLLLTGLEGALARQSRFQMTVGSAFLAVLLVLVSFRLVRSSYPGGPTQRDLAFLATAFVLMLVVLWAGYKMVPWVAERVDGPLEAAHYRYLVPVAFGALVVRLIVGVEAAGAFSIVSALTAGWMMDASLSFAIYTGAGCLAASSVADRLAPRRRLVPAAARICLVQVAACVVLALLESRLDPEFGPEVVLAVVSGAVSALLATLLLPVAELFFGFTTAYRLFDLANLNHPLLKELLVEAPATYHHSILVGTLAEAGALAIGAHPILARVGGYYHDVGKLKNPRAYVENEPGQFPHPSPEEEARELRRHVEDGLELAARHRIAPPVLEIVAQHHGTGVVRSAYQRATELRSLVDRAAFSYAGPRPLSKEAALVLLADRVEFESRGLAQDVGLDEAKLEQAVRRSLTEALEDGQLDDCDITLRDLGLVVAAFAEVLGERLLRRGRPSSLVGPGARASVTVVRPPLGGEPN